MQIRSQIFRQIVRKRRRWAGAQQGICVQYDGKDASRCAAKPSGGLCAVLPKRRKEQEEGRKLGGRSEELRCRCATNFEDLITVLKLLYADVQVLPQKCLYIEGAAAIAI